MGELISVIIPIYNVEKYMDDCLKSVTEQTYKNIEIILINDGSRDNSIDKCYKWMKKDVRIKVYNKENGGASSARNYGLDRAMGEYIVFVDSDDYINDHMLEKLYEALKENKCQISMCNSVRVFDSDVIIKDELRSETEIWNEEKYWEKYYLCPEDKYIVLWNKLYPKKIFEELRLPEGRLFEDEMVMHKIIGKCSKIAYIDEKLYYYLQRQGSSMNQSYTYRTFDVVEANTNRSIYFYSKGYYKLAETSLTQNISRIIDIKENLDMKNKINYDCYKREKKQFTDAYFKLFKRLSIKSKANILTFVLGEKLYKITHIYKRIIR